MINAHNVVRILSNLVSRRLPSSESTTFSAKDEEVAERLFDNINTIMNTTTYHFENESTLDYDVNLDSDTEESDTDSDETTMNELDKTDYTINKSDKKNTLLNQYSLEYMDKAVQFYDERNSKTSKRKHSWNMFHRHFKRVPNRGYITYFRKYLASGGTKRYKINQIDAFVYESCENARGKLLSFHDIDLRRWGLRKAKEILLNDFVASEKWLFNFKHRYNIYSRKITKLVTKREVQNEQEIHKSANDFVSNTQKIIKKYNPDYVLNTDQSGLQLELYSNRTLSFQGEKTTLAAVHSVHNTTHSYTVQPMISMSGHLVGPLLLCLKEPSGRLTENVKKSLFQTKNIILTCSKSGKLSTSLLQYWRDNVLEPAIGTNKFLLISDSWDVQSNKTLYEKLKNCQRIEIPKRTTSWIQPLDVYFNRQFKAIARKVYDHIRLDNIDINISQRNNIIKLNSLINNQLSSKRFVPMIKYAWYKSGYIKDNPGAFQNVKQICFSFTDISCAQNGCNDTCFITCSSCQKTFCFHHFFEVYHMH